MLENFVMTKLWTNDESNLQSFAGAMVGNSSLGRNGVGGGRSNYIMSAESEEAKNIAALATHVWEVREWSNKCKGTQEIERDRNAISKEF